MTETFDLIRHLRCEIAKEGSLRKLAKRLGISAAYLSSVMLGKQEAGPALLEPLGLKKTVIVEKRIRYERI